MKKKAFELPDDQCERLKRSEMMAMQLLLADLSNLRYAKDDLAARLESIPSGKARMNMLVGSFDSLVKDLIGTISDKQRHHLQGICRDMELRLVPKFSAGKTSVVLTKDEGKELVNAAQRKCVDCVKDAEEARSCKLCQLLEAVVPLDKYDGFLCPYNLATWADE